jgi:hypothetical protein
MSGDAVSPQRGVGLLWLGKGTEALCPCLEVFVIKKSGEVFPAKKS